MAYRTALDGVPLSELLKLNALEMAPRGVVLLVGCIGVLLGLCDELPNWDGCRTMLKGRSLRLRQPQLRIQRALSGASGSVTFWQQLERFDISSVSAVQRTTVANAIAADIGGLMQPRHLEQVSRGATVLARWLQGVHEALQTAHIGHATSTSPRSTLFDGSDTELCAVCHMRIEAKLMAQHRVLCATKQAEREAAAGREAQQRESEREKARVAELAAERIRRLKYDMPQYAPLPEPRAAPQPAAPTQQLQPPSPRAEAPPQPSPPPQRVAVEATAPTPQPDARPASARPRAPFYEGTEGGFDYLRAGQGTGLCHRVPAAQPVKQPGAVVRDRGRGAASSAASASEHGLQPSSGNAGFSRAVAHSAARSDEGAGGAAGAAARLETRARGGRPRAHAARPSVVPPRRIRPARDGADDDDGEPLVVLSREDHVRAVAEQLGIVRAGGVRATSRHIHHTVSN